ncbi:MAG: bifunctional [glutamine synthetase] adenylyltransferase/[glutamine synthetase]-adenylyl-L-tyrosine phosphorylase [Longispora sp.]|nr:bifunctional [glutamine synthetase] adenylyltransferase/[glutamine synthetase]-adenylyl-L-tyrosine phosphorylase [Longispora sp. (in: high G+C Gram-positive bacteria)]
MRPADPELADRQIRRLAEGGVTVEPDSRLLAVLGASSALGDHLVAFPEDLPAVDGELPLTGDLRRDYRRALLRIAADDLVGVVDTEQTMVALSQLADRTMTAALPAKDGLAVIAMGKCGANELNYVSDVDVIFAAEGDMAAATTAATEMMARCSAAAWPVDAGLRPEGRNGPLVRTLASHAAYYRKWARTWEFQALLKARYAAGDPELARLWLHDVNELVWRAGERPNVVEDVRAMRQRVEEHNRSAFGGAEDAARHEIKLGPGGLRDIEFAVQLLQLVHGRGDETLRVAGTLPALRALTAGGYVGRLDGETLERAYVFLRTVEHRLQLQRLRRTHTVPTDPTGLRWLARAMGSSVDKFNEEWRQQAREVRRLHEKLLYRPLLEAVAKVPTKDLRLTPEAAGERLKILGFADPAGALRHIEALTGGVTRSAAIQRTLLPVMLAEWSDAPAPDRGLLAYRNVSEKLGSSPWFLRLLRDSGPVAIRLARVLVISRYVTDLLARDAEALRLLADDRELVPVTRQALVDGLVATVARHDADPGEVGPSRAPSAIVAIRARRRRELLRLAFAYLLGLLDPRTLGQALTDVTEAVLEATLLLHRPQGRFAIIGMGRLGGSEINFGSDADVLFVCDDGEEAASTAVAEQLRALLGQLPLDPPLVVDAGLRPEGRQGALVRSLSAYRQYYERWADVWEVQALLRARPVAGSMELAEEFIAMADTIRYPVGGFNSQQVQEIRRIKARVDSERLPRGADPATHVKLGRGGLADIEWTVQLLQLRHGIRETSTLDALAAAGLDPADEAALRKAWLLASRVRDALTLIRGKPGDQLPRHGTELSAVAGVLGRRDPQAFVDEYLRTARRARSVVERLFYQS